jgi:hypothetical protein
MVKWQTKLKTSLNMEITFKLLYEKTNNEVKLNDRLKEDMRAVFKQTRMGCGKNFIFQNSRSTQKRKTMCMMECVECLIIKG